MVSRLSQTADLLSHFSHLCLNPPQPTSKALYPDNTAKVYFSLNNNTRVSVSDLDCRLTLNTLRQLLSFACLSWLVSTASVSHAATNSEAELAFIAAIDNISQNRIDLALEQLSELTQEAPKFKLAKLIYADLLAARSGMFNPLGSGSSLDPARLQALKEEAKTRVSYHQNRPSGDDLLPENLVLMNDNQRFAIVVDITQSRLYVFANDNGVPRLIKDYYASSGKAGPGKQVKGDNKTPIGVYFVTSRIPAKKLPSKYGAGALPLNYPNSWDNQLNKTGHGIWLHGSPLETYSRQPQASEGCISLTNVDFSELDGMVNIAATPVIIGRSIRWIDKQRWLEQQQQFSQLIADWAADWESLNNDQYSANYSRDFKTHRDNFDSWTKRKSWANNRKSYIDIDIRNLSLFTYPDDSGMLVASFDQDFKSSNYNGTDIKRQYWRHEQGEWKVVFEGRPSRGNP